MEVRIPIEFENRRLSNSPYMIVTVTMTTTSVVLPMGRQTTKCYQKSFYLNAQVCLIIYVTSSDTSTHISINP